jgi:hypothetical protein
MFESELKEMCIFNAKEILTISQRLIVVGKNRLNENKRKQSTTQECRAGHWAKLTKLGL